MTDEAGLVALDGRPLGERGIRTRRRILDATGELLATGGIRDLKVVDIARSVGTSAATFYQYFPDVESAVLVLVEEIREEYRPLGEILGAQWSDEGSLDELRRFVQGFVELFDRHRAILRTRNLAAQEGDVRFRRARANALNVVIEPLAAKVVEAQKMGRVSSAISSQAAAAGLVTMTERLAAFHYELEPRGVTLGDLVETVARIIHQVATGAEGT